MAAISAFTLPIYQMANTQRQQQALNAPSLSAAPSNLSTFPENNPGNSQEINIALSLLGDIKNNPADTDYLKRQGINIIFSSGKEALDLIQQNHIKVVFGDMGDSLAHAQWLTEQNTIMVNQKYKGDFSKASLYAISEAIYHEAGHAAKLTKNNSFSDWPAYSVPALTFQSMPDQSGFYNKINQNKDVKYGSSTQTQPTSASEDSYPFSAKFSTESGDGQSSIQEELDCLALNTLGYRYHTSIDPSFATTANTSRLIQDGVALYNRLFFPENDPNLTGLQARVKEKYGMLPAESPDHPIPMVNGQVPIADRVCRYIQTWNSFNTVA